MTHLSIVPANPRPERISTADTAKLIRRALKAAFPGYPARFFSVTSSVYSGGSSIDVSWTDGPSADLVDDVVQPFAGATFDGMQDLKSYTNAVVEGLDGKPVRPGADYIFTRRSYSPRADAALTRKANAHYGWGVTYRSGYPQDRKADGTMLEHHERVWLAKFTKMLSIAPNGVTFWTKGIN